LTEQAVEIPEKIGQAFQVAAAKLRSKDSYLMQLVDQSGTSLGFLEMFIFVFFVSIKEYFICP
jgi:hypothetical protein